MKQIVLRAEKLNQISHHFFSVARYALSINEGNTLLLMYYAAAMGCFVSPRAVLRLICANNNQLVHFYLFICSLNKIISKFDQMRIS
jgi:hypothetical protein